MRASARSACCKQVSRIQLTRIECSASQTANHRGVSLRKTAGLCSTANPCTAIPTRRSVPGSGIGFMATFPFMAFSRCSSGLGWWPSYCSLHFPSQAAQSNPDLQWSVKSGITSHLEEFSFVSHSRVTHQDYDVAEKFTCSLPPTAAIYGPNSSSIFRFPYRWTGDPKAPQVRVAGRRTVAVPVSVADFPLPP